MHKSPIFISYWWSYGLTLTDFLWLIIEDNNIKSQIKYETEKYTKIKKVAVASGNKIQDLRRSGTSTLTTEQLYLITFRHFYPYLFKNYHVIYIYPNLNCNLKSVTDKPIRFLFT